jgi:hypothetical protein
MWEYCYIEEILPNKFFKTCFDKSLIGWELTKVESKHYSGFTLHRAEFKKYKIES